MVSDAAKIKILDGFHGASTGSIKIFYMLRSLRHVLAWAAKWPGIFVPLNLKLLCISPQDRLTLRTAPPEVSSTHCLEIPKAMPPYLFG